MHHIVASAAINMIELRLSGFCSISDVAAIETDLKALFASGKLKPEYLLLVDVTECAVQSQDVLFATAEMVKDKWRAKRIAVISNSAMVNIQLGRVISRPYLRIVTDRRPALDWLIRQVEPRRAA